MGWRFRRSRRLLPGVRVTQTHRGLGWGFGGPWLRVNRSPGGRWSRTIGVPGTGLSHVTRLSGPPGALRPTSPARAAGRRPAPLPSPAAGPAPSPRPVGSPPEPARPTIPLRLPRP